MKTNHDKVGLEPCSNNGSPPPPIPDRPEQMLQGGFGDFRDYLDSKAQEVVDPMELVCKSKQSQRNELWALD